MTLLQFLVNKVADEASEVAQAASKCLEHGEMDYNPKERRTCLDHLRYEYNDLSSAIALHRAVWEWLTLNRHLCEYDLPEMLERASDPSYLHDPKTIRIVWFAVRAMNKGLMMPSTLESCWLQYQQSGNARALTTLTREMDEKFGLTPFH